MSTDSSSPSSDPSSQSKERSFSSAVSSSYSTASSSRILYSSSCSDDDDDVAKTVCKKWWIPSAVSLATSLVLVFQVQAKLFLFWKISRGVHRERNDNRTLTRCVLELRMKGSSLDLSKEPMSGKRMKSSSVEIKWKPVTWFSQYLRVAFPCF